VFKIGLRADFELGSLRGKLHLKHGNSGIHAAIHDDFKLGSFAGQNST